jgi:hypothetical protein
MTWWEKSAPTIRGTNGPSALSQGPAACSLRSQCRSERSCWSGRGATRSTRGDPPSGSMRRVVL